MDSFFGLCSSFPDLPMHSPLRLDVPEMRLDQFTVSTQMPSKYLSAALFALLVSTAVFCGSLSAQQDPQSLQIAQATYATPIGPSGQDAVGLSVLAVWIIFSCIAGAIARNKGNSVQKAVLI